MSASATRLILRPPLPPLCPRSAPPLPLDHYERDLAVYPPSMANLEGGIVLDWLGYGHLADSCGLFTAAPAKHGNERFYQQILQLRATAGLPHRLMLKPVAERKSRAGAVCPEPTIWFELGCKRREQPTAGPTPKQPPTTQLAVYPSNQGESLHSRHQATHHEARHHKHAHSRSSPKTKATRRMDRLI